MSDTDDSKKHESSVNPPTTVEEALETPAEAEKKSASKKASDDEGDVEGGEVVESKKPAKEPAPPPPTMAQWLFLGGVAVVTAGIDLWSKSWAIKRLSIPSPRVVPLCTPPSGATHYLYQRLPQNEIVLSRNYLEMRYAENCGGAWGLLHGASEKVRRPFFFLITVLAILFIVHLYRSLEKDQRAMRIALPLVLGGAIGNLVDRLRLGYVVDFILMHWKEKFYWPTYNVADIAITVGIVLMLFEFIFGGKPKTVTAKAESKKKSDKPESAEAATAS
ncbi:MAG: signal peptidase II [Myxococcales bacterium]|nr:signal peptidase II [Myxococcales bacterium]